MRTIATVGGLGFVPKIPGTLASAVGLLISWILAVHPACQIIGCAVAIALALWSAGPTARALGKPDPDAIVIDEVTGMMTALAALPRDWRLYLAGFVLFRLLDIVKPLGIRRLERLPGGLGIVLDDLAAGAATNFLLHLLLRFW